MLFCSQLLAIVLYMYSLMSYVSQMKHSWLAADLQTFHPMKIKVHMHGNERVNQSDDHHYGTGQNDCQVRSF